MSKSPQLLVLEPPVELKFKGLLLCCCRIDCAMHYVIKCLLSALVIIVTLFMLTESRKYRRSAIITTCVM